MPRETELTGADLKRLNVVAGILRNAAGDVLITERLEQGPFRGMWEFPGGKIGRDERPDAALVRELREEIGIEVVDLRAFIELEHRYPDRHVAIRFFLIEAWRNPPAGLEGQRLKWVPATALAAENLLPADQPVIEALLRL